MITDPTTLSQLDFNSRFFPRCNDHLFKVALMFLKYNPFSESCQDFLLHADRDNVYYGLNLLAFTETYNQTHQHLTSLITDLQSVQNESSWYITRSKIYTKFAMFNVQTVNFDKIDKQFPYTHHPAIRQLKTGSILWQNAIHLVQEQKGYQPQQTDQIWELWQALILYYQKNVDNIIPKKELVQEFEKVMHHRLNNDFFKKHKLSYEKNSPEIKSMLNVHQALSTIMLKNEFESTISSPDTFVNKVKKVLKL